MFSFSKRSLRRGVTVVYKYLKVSHVPEKTDLLFDEIKDRTKINKLK